MALFAGLTLMLGNASVLYHNAEIIEGILMAG